MIQHRYYSRTIYLVKNALAQQKLSVCALVVVLVSATKMELLMCTKPCTHLSVIKELVLRKQSMTGSWYRLLA